METNTDAMPNAPATVAEYLKALPEERRKALSSVRAVLRKHLPKGYVETLDWGMISYVVPLSAYPTTYNGHPLCYAGLAARKGGYALYLMSAYAKAGAAAWLKEEFRKAGKKLDMGTSCIRFRRPDDLPLAAIGKLVASTPMKAYIALYERSRAEREKGP